MEKSPEAFRTISEVASWLDTPAHVLRFWESRFPQIAPVKRAGGRRYYRPDDMRLLGGIKHLLHTEGMAIKAVQAKLDAEGSEAVSKFSPEMTFAAAPEDSGSDNAEPEAAAQPASEPEMLSPEDGDLPHAPTDDPVLEESVEAEEEPAAPVHEPEAEEARVEDAASPLVAEIMDDPAESAPPVVSDVEDAVEDPDGPAVGFFFDDSADVETDDAPVSDDAPLTDDAPVTDDLPEPEDAPVEEVHAVSSEMPSIEHLPLDPSDTERMPGWDLPASALLRTLDLKTPDTRQELRMFHDRLKQLRDPGV